MNSNQQSPLLKCFVNGKCETLSIEDAHRQLWRANYGWLRPLNWYRWSVEGYRSSEYLLRKTTPQPIWFSLNVHLRQEPLSIDDCERMVNEISQERALYTGQKRKQTELDGNNFVAWVARFHKVFYSTDKSKSLPKELWPLYFEPAFIGQHRRQRPAYRIRPGMIYMVIDGIHPDFDDTIVPLEWNRFLEPPK